VNVNGAPETWSVRDGVIYSTGHPICILRTERMFENFVVDLEWLHETEGGNAGLFLHGSALPVKGQPFAKGIEVQVIQFDHPSGISTRHGDVFAIQGATMVPDRPHPRGWMRCLPSEKRTKGPGEWNHYRVESQDGIVKLSVNGKEVSGGSKCVPRKGYLCLESEGAPARFRNLRILERPSTHPPPGEVAEADEGFVSIFNGLDTRGWKGEGDWGVVEDWVLDPGTRQAVLRSDRTFANYSLMLDWRIKPGSEGGSGGSAIFPRGEGPVRLPIGKDAGASPGQWHRSLITLRGDRFSAWIDGKPRVPDEDRSGRSAGPVVLKVGNEDLQFANLFVREFP
jgi:hypothetical protein